MNANGTIVVIGGSSGIGLEVARRSLADGATVVIAGRSQERLDAARAELARTGPAAAGWMPFRPTSATWPRSLGFSTASERSATWS